MNDGVVLFIYKFLCTCKGDSATEPRTTEPRKTEPRKTQPWMDWTSNGLNPEWTQPRMGLNPEWDSTPNCLNPEWDWTPNGPNLEWDWTPNGTEPRMDWTLTGLKPDWDSTPNGLNPDWDSTSTGTQPRPGISTPQAENWILNGTQPRHFPFNPFKKESFSGLSLSWGWVPGPQGLNPDWDSTPQLRLNPGMGLNLDFPLNLSNMVWTMCQGVHVVYIKRMDLITIKMFSLLQQLKLSPIWEVDRCWVPFIYSYSYITLLYSAYYVKP